MDEIKIKSCPFCGSEGNLIKRPYTVKGTNDPTYMVECTNGSCMANYMIGTTFFNEQSAIDAWNKRVVSD